MEDDYDSIGNNYDKNKILLNIAKNRATSYAEDNVASKSDKGVKFDVSEKGSIKPSKVKYLPEGSKLDNAFNNYSPPRTKYEQMNKLFEQRKNENDEELLETYKNDKASKEMKQVYNKQVNPNLTRDTSRNVDSVKHTRNIFQNTRKGGKKRSSKKTKRNLKTKSKRKH